MQRERASFVLYTDLYDSLNMLSDREAGAVFKAVFHYQATGELPQKLSRVAALLFDNVRRQLDRDAQKYAETIRKRSEAGKRGAMVTHSRRTEQIPQTGGPSDDALMDLRSQRRSDSGLDN